MLFKNHWVLDICPICSPLTPAQCIHTRGRSAKQNMRTNTIIYILLAIVNKIKYSKWCLEVNPLPNGYFSYKTLFSWSLCISIIHNILLDIFNRTPKKKKNSKNATDHIYFIQYTMWLCSTYFLSFITI